MWDEIVTRSREYRKIWDAAARDLRTIGWNLVWILERNDLKTATMNAR